MKILKVTVLTEDYNTCELVTSGELNINLETLWFYKEGPFKENKSTTRVTYSDKTHFIIDVPYTTFDALIKGDNHKLAHLFYTDGENQ